MVSRDLDNPTGITINGKACADYALTRRFSVVYSLRDYDLGVVNDGKAVERVTT